jgi:hypothetical protein
VLCGPRNRRESPACCNPPMSTPNRPSGHLDSSRSSSLLSTPTRCRARYRAPRVRLKAVDWHGARAVLALSVAVGILAAVVVGLPRRDRRTASLSSASVSFIVNRTWARRPTRGYLDPQMLALPFRGPTRPTRRTRVKSSRCLGNRVLFPPGSERRARRAARSVS